MSWGGWSSGNDGSALFPELSTPNTVAEYEQLSKATLQQLLLFARQSDATFKCPEDLIVAETDVHSGEHPWVQINSIDDPEEVSEEWQVQTLDRTGDESAITCIKTTALMPCSIERLTSLLSTQNTRERQKWDPDLIEMSVLKTISTDLDVVYRNYRAALSVVAPRDFVVLNGRYQSKNLHVIYGTSINFPEQRVASKSVRGVAMSGYIVERMEGSGSAHRCRCSRFVRVDPKGMIPFWVISASKQSAGRSMLSLRNTVRLEAKIRPEVMELRSLVVLPSGKQKAHHDTRIVDPPSSLHEPMVGSPNDQLVSSAHHHTTKTFPLPRMSSEEFHRHQEAKRQSQQHQEQELMTKIQRRNEQRQQTQPISDPQVDKLLSSLSNIEEQLESNRQLIQRLSTTIETERTERQRLSRLLEKCDVGAEEPTGVSLGWDLIGFALIWPFATYALADFISGRIVRR